MSQEPEDCRQVNSMDLVIDLYKKDVDRSLLVESLRLTLRQRFERFERFMAGVFELQKAGQKARGEYK